MRDSCLARVSDDFYPRLPASHTTHVAVCSYNSLFFGPVVQPDWDMFHSLHPRYVNGPCLPPVALLLCLSRGLHLSTTCMRTQTCPGVSI